MSSREPFDEAIRYMSVLSNPDYANYVFYLYMVSQCRIVLDEELPAAAAVSFHYDHYNLYINPTKFGSHPVIQRVGIIKHEMLHILYNHIRREESHMVHENFNLATDCALNQHITRNHLPSGVIYPDVLAQIIELPVSQVPDNQSAEFYYNLIQNFAEQNPDKCSPSGCPNGVPEQVDDHSKWEESKGDSEIQKDVAKRMAERSAEQTQRSRGNLPSNYSDWIQILTTERVVNWKQVLKRIIGNKRVGHTPTLYKPNRRQPDASHIKGRIKDRKFDLLVVADVSGSVSDKELAYGIAEINHLCKQTQTPVKLIQVDTAAHEPEPISSRTNKFHRKACGGTYLYPAIEKAYERKVPFNAVVVITDGGISSEDLFKFEALNLKVIWLLTDKPHLDFNTGKMKAIKLI